MDEGRACCIGLTELGESGFGCVCNKVVVIENGKTGMEMEREARVLLSTMKRYIAPHIVARGEAYYESGLVEDVSIDGNWACAVVLGNYGDYEVRVNTVDFGESKCDCPYDTYCKHLAAVCFFVAREKRNEFKVGKCVEIEEKQPQRDNETAGIMGRLDSMEKEDLLDVLRMLVEDNPLLSGKIALVLNERQHVAELHSDRVRQMGLYSSLKFYSEAIPRVLSECEALFSEVEGCDDDWEDGYYDEDEVTEWDFSAGLERLHRYGRELLDMVTQQHYISGTVGLLVGLLGLEDWKDEYLAEYGDQELEEGCDEFHSYLCEALGRVKGYRRADAAAQDFLFELMDWMVLQCNEPGGLADWAWLLSDCVVDLQGLRHLETSIRRLDQDFLQSNRLEDERKRRPLVYWWVDLCLQYDREQEAIEAAGVLRDTGDDSVERLFVRYYERNERWQEAVVVLGELIKGKAGPADYRWMADLCKQAGDLTREKEWLQKWFLSFPDFELFKRNVELLTEREEREKTIEFWLAALKKKEYFELIIQIYLFLNDPESAWKEYTRHGQHVFENNPILLKLFKEMKRRDPSKLIPQYKSLIMHNIGRRDRSSYAIAARWLKDLQEVCFLAGEEEKWTEFYHGIMSEYKRFRALMEEIRRVIK